MLPVADVPSDLSTRILAALGGAWLGERMAGTPTGVDQLLEAALSVGGSGGYDEADHEARGLAVMPGAGPSALVLRAVAYGLVSPLDRPLLRRSAHRSALLAGADAGTAKTAVAAAVLAADLLRFDLDWCLARLHQTLLEEAPSALLQRLRPLPDHAPLSGDDDPGAALQVAITAVHRAETVPGVVEEMQSYGEDLRVALSLGGALAGSRDGLRGDGVDGWTADLPARVRDAAGALAAAARARLPQPQMPLAIESPHDDRD